MKHLKLTVLLAVTAAALFAAAGASATTLTGAEGTPLTVGTVIKAENEGALTLHPPIGPLTCNKTSISGKITNAGGIGETVKVTLETFLQSECNATFTVLKQGTLEIHTQNESANGNGTLTWSGTEVTVEISGFHCVFSTNNTDIGTLEGSTTTGGNATLEITGNIPRTGGRSGVFCGNPSVQWTGSFKFTTPSTLNIDGTLTGEAPTGQVGSTSTITWKNDSESSLTIDQETSSDETVAKLAGSACGTISATSSCTSRKVECLKAGEATLSARDIPSVEAQVKVKCDKVELTGEVPTATVGETVTVTWKNDAEGAIAIDHEVASDETVIEKTGTACTTIAGTGSCTSRKVKCLKAGEATLTAKDTPLIEGQVTVKCHAPPTLTGEAPTPIIGETITITWKNHGESAITIEDETNSDSSVAETVGTGCETIAATSSCTNRKLKCLKAGEVTLTARDTPSIEGQVKVKCHTTDLTGTTLTMVVGEAASSITWDNGGETSLTIDDEVFSNETVVEKSGSACTTIAAKSSCTSRKVKCLKKGEVTVTARDTPLVEGQLTIKCHDLLDGGPGTANVGETVTVTWTNNSGSSVLIEDESTSDGTVAETLGSSCGAIASKASCTSRKIKCLKKGESTITAVDTPSVEGKFVIKCD